MTAFRRRSIKHRKPSLSAIILPLGGLLSFGLLTLYILSPANDPGQPKQTTLLKTPSRLLHHLDIRNRTVGGPSSDLPPRVNKLLRRNEIIGDHLADIKAGLSTVQDALHSETKSESSQLPPMTMTEVIDFFNSFLRQLHEQCTQIKRATFPEIWQTYHDLALQTLYPWDKEYLRRMPKRRSDGSLYISLASYRDENCLSTITNAYKFAKHPDKLNVGLVQQNCYEHCRSGVLENRRMEDVEPDDDCHNLFCSSPEGKPHCDSGRVRALLIREPESLGPYAARYFASKLWNGEEWYMQIDSHMTFLRDWDALSIEMLENAPSSKPVMSHYPPNHTTNLERNVEANRLCTAGFATSDLEVQIIRLGGGPGGRSTVRYPRFSAYVAAGYFVAHSGFLRDVPFDPFLPWIFMGEEIVLSARLWTSGYDIFAPTRSVVGHIYYRRHKPKFWESVHRLFTFGVHNPLQMLILNRIKYQLGYPESARDMVMQKSVFTAVEEYGMGAERTLDEYLEMVGLDMVKKKVYPTEWCNAGRPPKGFEKYASLYE